MTGAGHSKNVFSTPAGFSSRRGKKHFYTWTFLQSKHLSLTLGNLAVYYYKVYFVPVFGLFEFDHFPAIKLDV